jgi:hypothetical protein
VPTSVSQTQSQSVDIDTDDDDNNGGHNHKHKTKIKYIYNKSTGKKLPATGAGALGLLGIAAVSIAGALAAKRAYKK